jgi:ABC-type lipoprotein export system ATPase subunit
LISARSHLEDWFCLAGEVTVTLVKDTILAVHQGEFVAITGASGSAKSLLLYLLLCAASLMNSSAWASSNGGTVRARAQQRDLVFRRHPQPRRR